jgi:hypothetical protein
LDLEKTPPFLRNLGLPYAALNPLGLPTQPLGVTPFLRAFLGVAALAADPFFRATREDAE